MNKLASLRWGAAYPLYAVVLSAALFVTVSLSLALQPPTGDGGTLPGALEWANALFFSGGAALFVLAIIAYARPRSEPPTTVDAPEAEDDVVAFGEPEAVRFTLISVRLPGEIPTGIADFPGAEALLAALRRWRQLYPDEEFRVFSPDGHEIARRAPADGSVVGAGDELPARRPVRRRVSPAMGGV